MAGRAQKHRAEVLPQTNAESWPPGWGKGTESVTTWALKR